MLSCVMCTHVLWMCQCPYVLIRTLECVWYIYVLCVLCCAYGMMCTWIMHVCAYMFHKAMFVLHMLVWYTCACILCCDCVAHVWCALVCIMWVYVLPVCVTNVWCEWYMCTCANVLCMWYEVHRCAACVVQVWVNFVAYGWCAHVYACVVCMCVVHMCIVYIVHVMFYAHVLCLYVHVVINYFLFMFL